MAIKMDPNLMIIQELKETNGIKYSPYDINDGEKSLREIIEMIERDLSEPYSIYTFRYFVNEWPELCILARNENDNSLAGVIICKADRENKRKRMRGYIAMLAVSQNVRKLGIGSSLAQQAIMKMKSIGCDEVVLETELTNTGALNLYRKLGFFRDKRLRKYYLNGGDAYRLKLHFTDWSINGLDEQNENSNNNNNNNSNP